MRLHRDAGVMREGGAGGRSRGATLSSASSRDDEEVDTGLEATETAVDRSRCKSRAVSIFSPKTQRAQPHTSQQDRGGLATAAVLKRGKLLVITSDKVSGQCMINWRLEVGERCGDKPNHTNSILTDIQLSQHLVTLKIMEPELIRTVFQVV